MMQILRLFSMLVLLCSLVLVPADALAQEKIVVEGSVKDSDGAPLIGVSVIEIGTTNGVNSDIRGNYRLQAAKGAKLRFSYVGYKSQTLQVNSSVLNVKLDDDETKIDQVVVTGYSQVELRKSTGSVGILDEKDLKGAPLASIDYLIKGKLAGVNVQAVSGRPGEAAKIRIRGISSITGNSEPLWVIDGVPMQKEVPKVTASQITGGDFTRFLATGIGGINPNDIASITVLKDAAATAIYGSQASAGVIVVTTKRGQPGQTRVDYSGSVSVQTRPTRMPDLMNSREKLAWEQELWDEFSASGFAQSTHYPVVGIVGMIRAGVGKYAGMSVASQDAHIAELGKHTTNWFEELFRNSISTSHHVSVSGGTEKLTHRTSVGYSRNNGILLNNHYDSYNITSRIDARPNKRLSFGLSTDFAYQKSNSPSENTSPITYAYFANPYERPYNADGSYRTDETYYALPVANKVHGVKLPNNGFSLMRELNESSTLATNSNLSLRANVDYKFTEHFRFSGIASFSYSSDFSENINGKDTYIAFQDRPFENNTLSSDRTYGSISQNSAYTTGYMLRGQLNYGRTFNEIHRISVLGGAEIRSTYAKSVAAKRYGYDPVSGNHSTPLPPAGEDGKIDYDKLIQFGRVLDGCVGQYISESAFASFYGAIDYALMNRYVFNFSIRTDGSNNFGSKEQFNATWSAGFAWNIDEENFMKGAISKAISSMTLTLATGYTGGVNKLVYPQLIMDYIGDFRKTEADLYRIGNIKNAPNPHLRWERTQDMKAGLNIGFLKERLRLQAEVYHRKGIDLVTKVGVPVTTGFNSQSYNTSEQFNQGLELTLSATPVMTKGFTWGISANISYNRNKLTKYATPNGSMQGELVAGYPQGKIFTGKLAGIQEDTGFYEYVIRPDAVFDEMADYKDKDNYLFYVGTNNAPWSGGFSTNFSYKGLTLSISGSFLLKGIVFNDITPPATYSKASSSGAGKEFIPTHKNDLYVNHVNVVRDVTNRWTPGNPRTDAYPRLIDAVAGPLIGPNGVPIMDFLPKSQDIVKCATLENISYLKISSIAMMYSLPDRWVKKMHMNSLGVSFTLNNIHTFTNYSGIDPETPGAVYPQSLAFSFGVTMGF